LVKKLERQGIYHQTYYPEDVCLRDYKMPEKILIKDATILTMDQKNRVIEKGAILIEKDRIIDVDKTDRIEKKYNYDVDIDGRGKVVIPGLINTHLHSHIVTRGVYEDPPLENRMYDLYYPILSVLKPDDIYVFALASYIDAIKSGSTCIVDMYRHLGSCAKAAERVGIRAVLSCEAADLIDGQETLEDNEKAYIEYNNIADGRIKVWFGVEWVPVCSPEFIRKAKNLGEKYRTGIHIHLNEEKSEIDECVRKYGKRPIEHVHDLGLLGRNVIGAHCTWLTDHEIEIIWKTGMSVSYNPVSNARWGVGIAPISKLLKVGVNVSLGTDEPANMLETLKFAGIIQKGIELNPNIIPSRRVLQMATVNGAYALGAYKDLGSIEKGKKADLTIMDLNKIHTVPVLSGDRINLHTKIVLEAHHEDVEIVIIDGKVVMKDRKLLTANEKEVIEKATTATVDALERIKK